MIIKCLGLECTAHTWGASVVDDKCNVLSNEKASFSSKEKGMVPREVLEFHKQNRDSVVESALVENVDLIAVSQGPGIGTMLHEGIEYSKALAKKLKVPLIGVNHVIAHFEIGWKKCGAEDPVILYASGGNTQILVFEREVAFGASSWKRWSQGPSQSSTRTICSGYQVVGETLDIGLGNLLDKSARFWGLGFPGGPLLYELSLKGKNFVDLPYNVKGMDVCFSGLYTDFTRKAQSHTKEDMAFSLQEVAFDMVCETAERALAHYGKKELLLAGGVCCSKTLQEKARKMCKERGAKALIPDNSFLSDNAAMIAWTGLLAKRAGQKPLAATAKAEPQWRPEEVAIKWR
ncbi:UGMP family protein [Candidatus Micrarchaeota archaeon]|nr:UGMP family protein [Candidatus Micrarchaeota archaeon]